MGNSIKKIRLHLFVFPLVLMIAGNASAQNSFLSKSVALVFVDTIRPCVFFQLIGVSQADPVLPNQPWFAISTSYINAQIETSLLMTVKASAATVNVQTDGTLACGLPHVQFIQAD